MSSLSGGCPKIASVCLVYHIHCQLPRRSCTSKTAKIRRFVKFVMYCFIAMCSVECYWHSTSVCVHKGLLLIDVCPCSELECVGSTVTLTVTGGQSQTFVNGSEVTVSCQLHHVRISCCLHCTELVVGGPSSYGSSRGPFPQSRPRQARKLQARLEKYARLSAGTFSA